MATQTYVDAVTLSGAAEWNKWDTAAYAALTGASGTNTITATGPANLTLVATNPPLWFIPAATNTGATTINITPSGGAALGAKNIFSGGAACVGGEIVIGVPCAIVYDGTQYNLITQKAITNGTTASTFTFDGSGGSTGSLTMNWQKHGLFVDLDVPAALATTGTSSTALVSNTALPTAIRPTVQHVFATNKIVNNAAASSDAGILVVNTNGTVQISRNGAGAAFQNSAQGGMGAATTVRYFIG